MRRFIYSKFFWVLSLLALCGCLEDTVKKANSSTMEHKIISTEPAAAQEAHLKGQLTFFMDSLIRANHRPSVKLEDQYERACEGVFLIYTEDSWGRISQGTGFLIRHDGIILTNYHVINDMADGSILNRHQQVSDIQDLLAYNEAEDWAILKADDTFAGGLVLPVAREMPRIGEACFTIGNPLGFEQTLSTGIISAYREEGVIQTTAEATFGSSGGPLFNQRGEVIGIIKSGMGEANLNFAVNIQRVPLADLIGHEPVNPNWPFGLPARSRIRASVEAYFDALLVGDEQALVRVYAPKVEKYHDDFALSASKAAKRDIAWRWQSAHIPISFEPTWNALTLNARESGLSLTLPVLFTALERSSNQLITEDHQYKIAMDSLYKIQRIESYHTESAN